MRLFVARCFVLGLAGQGSLTLGLAMLLDVMAHGRRESGRAREGLMVGVFALAEKGAFAFGPLLTGLLLGAMGFVSEHRRRSRTAAAGDPRRTARDERDPRDDRRVAIGALLATACPRRPSAARRAEGTLPFERRRFPVAM